MIVWASGCLSMDIHSTVHETASILGGLCGVIQIKCFLVITLNGYVTQKMKIRSFGVCSTRTRFCIPLHCFSIVYLCKPAQDGRRMIGVIYTLVNVYAFVV